MPEPDLLIYLADWVDAGTSFVKGDTLQVGFRPQNAPDRCVLISDIGGGKTYIEDSSRNRFDYMIQFISRANSRKQASDDIHEIHAFIYEGQRGFIQFPNENPTVSIENIDPVSLPQQIGRDDKHRFEYSCNYKLECFRN